MFIGCNTAGEEAADRPEPSIAADSYEQSWKRLLSRTVPQDELPSLIGAIFSDREAIGTVDCLRESDAQVFIDVVYEVRHYALYLTFLSTFYLFLQALGSLELAQRIRRRCVRSLYKMCARHSLLPRSLQVELCYDPASAPLCGGGFADVWKGKCRGLEVAVKVLRKYPDSDLEKITHVSRL